MSTPSGTSPQQQPASSHGAVDLSGRGAPGPEGAGRGGLEQPGLGQAALDGGAAAQAGGSPLLGRWSIELDEASFQDLVQASNRVPVLLAVTSERVPGAAQMRQDLVQAIDGEQGRMVLGFADADSQPRIAQALQVQQIPAVFAVLGGRPMPLFVGPVDATHIAAMLQELQGVAIQQGMSGSVPPLNQDAAEAEAPSRFAQAEALTSAADFDGAAAIYEAALTQNPGDDEAVVGLHRVRLLERVNAMEASAVRAAAASQPDDLQSQLDVADLDVVGGHVEDAFKRLISFIARHYDETREPARAHLVELFGVVGQQDPRVTVARGKLAGILF